MGSGNLWERSFQLLVREWLLCASVVGLLITSFHLRRFPLYEKRDFEIVFLLGLFFVQIKGLERANVFKVLAYHLKRGRAPGLKLLAGTFFLAAFITNDLALLITVPLCLELGSSKLERSLVFLALAANAGSAFTPIGNPQNLFIYWFYQVHIFDFVREILPLSAALGLLLLGLGALFLRTDGPHEPGEPPAWDRKRGLSFLFLATLCLALVFKIIPLPFGLIILLVALWLDPKSSKIDYMLLLTFLAFFGFTDNLRASLKIQLQNKTQVFWAGALISQFLSNVPTTLLLADFTPHWRDLLWGVNVGGFGNLIGSLANLIVFRFYLKTKRPPKEFLLSFHLWGYLFFFLGIVLYFFIHL
ncbi:MAG: hypothetical protein GXO20_00125 [Thermodesulfobacteria bacterium]|nr:hypothetical protein [Thermodesulfobacteriota bacterium]